MFDSFATHGLLPARLLCAWDFPGKLKSIKEGGAMLKAVESSCRSLGIVSVLYLERVAVCPGLFRTE